jgi:hypothetical protein
MAAVVNSTPADCFLREFLIENDRQHDNFFILNLNLCGCCKSVLTARFLREFLSEKILF